jgi:hypothetical protein
MGDYSAFSWESIQKSFRDIVEDIQEKTSATDEQMALALSVAAKKVMNTNCLAEPRKED